MFCVVCANQNAMDSGLFKTLCQTPQGLPSRQRWIVKLESYGNASTKYLDLSLEDVEKLRVFVRRPKQMILVIRSVFYIYLCRSTNSPQHPQFSTKLPPLNVPILSANSSLLTLSPFLSHGYPFTTHQSAPF